MCDLIVKVIVTLSHQELGDGESIVHAHWADFEGNFLQCSHRFRSEHDEKMMYRVFEDVVHNSIYCSLDIYEKKNKLVVEVMKARGIQDMETRVLELENQIDRLPKIMRNLKIDYVGV